MARRRLIARTFEEAEELSDLTTGEYVSFAASLLSQGKHRFFTLSMPSDVLAETCTVDRRAENPEQGFQRYLDKKRAQDIADYIDAGFGTIPTSIVLSAQDTAQMKYSSSKRTLRFRKVNGAFLILDGQHRVYGFHTANTRIRVPVVIYNNLSRAEECQLFMDINTKQDLCHQSCSWTLSSWRMRRRMLRPYFVISSTISPKIHQVPYSG